MRDAKSRIDADGISRMNSRPLHELHNTRDEHIRPVTDRVDLEFLPADIAVNENRLILVDFDSCPQIMS